MLKRKLNKLVTMTLCTGMILGQTAYAEGSPEIVETNTVESETTVEPMAVGDVSINAENFPDAVFRKYVSENFDINNNGVLSVDECDQAEEIVIDGLYEDEAHKLGDFQGIEYFKNIKDIYCANNKLVELDFSKNTKLESLYCNANKLIKLDISKNTALKKLYCGYNPLTKLDINNNVNLTELTCNFAKLTSLDTSKNLKLSTLECEGNQIEQLNLGTLPELTRLSCGHGSLSRLDVSGCPALKELFCTESGLTELNLANNTELEILECTDNKLIKLDVSKQPKLNSLLCANNRLSELNLSANTKIGYIASINPQKLDVTANEADGKWEIDLSSNVSANNLENIQVSAGTYDKATGKLTLPDSSLKSVNYTIKTGANLEIEGSGVPKLDELQVELAITYKGFVFSDVSKNAWYYSAVKYAYENGLITGTSDTTFSPNDPMTRGMLVSVLYRFAGRPEVSGKNEFPDVKPSKYYAAAIQWASENGIVSGYSDGKFGPEDPITREQMTKIFYQFVKLNGGDVSHSADVSVYKDADQIASYAARYVKWAVADGILKGSNGKLNPRGNATRAEVAAIMKRVIETYGLK